MIWSKKCDVMGWRRLESASGPFLSNDYLRRTVL
jgi:hypothetical protein